MLTPYYATLQTLTVDGPSVGSATGATTVLGSQGQYILPANFFTLPGQILRVRAAGSLTTAASSPGTVTWSILIGSNGITGAASATMTVSQTTGLWIIDGTFTLRSVGSSGTMLGAATFTANAIATAPAMGVQAIPATAAFATFTLNTTTTSTVDVQANFSATTNTLLCKTFQLDAVL